MTRPADALYEEIAFLAYHFHWSLDEILGLPHPLRERFTAEVARFHQRG
ncbi:MAG: hypothetical protein M3273_07215 [Actinomycetota bacterium]|nr:hypothetical protein [Actinomycetota bacterium]